MSISFSWHHQPLQVLHAQSRHHPFIPPSSTDAYEAPRSPALPNHCTSITPRCLRASIRFIPPAIGDSLCRSEDRDRSRQKSTDQQKLVESDRQQEKLKH
ncbi:hypothetical protein PR202_ga27809 [Eleusine coracana subsp. coracana]|uniref:Uncharacterized protein n=1 Tax=Eleusine coracana subsp. coracana TaxID=191504 RepID=A0AAV5DG61_ELECO|nr:hypothetical protein PR202_ga27809 [Eleusine coracana subsp. coracana]